MTVSTIAQLKVDQYGRIDMNIPSNAITACGSWYAGAGDYFYLIPDKRNMLKVFQGWQDEGQETPGYHWKKAKEIHF